MRGRIARALRTSPLELARRLLAERRVSSADAVRRKRDLVTPTFFSGTPELLQTFLAGIPAIECNNVADAVKLYCDHRFDLLGSGWTRVTYGMRCAGLEGISFEPHPVVIERPMPDNLELIVNQSNLAEAKRVWSLVGRDYEPIDWQLDFKSGFRWDSRTWYKDISFGSVLGADVKVPWELSRFQHLPQMAIEFGRTHAASLSSEFRNQILDWIATNPPRFGVNWFSSMDVAIRAANVLIARDLFQSYGAEFDPDFDLTLRRSIRDHSVHILENLEWSEELRANHYLSNIAGLIFCAAYLPAAAESDSWLNFGAAELATAISEQFNADGSNFEASTSYHRLSAEIAVFSLAALERSRDRLIGGEAQQFAKMHEQLSRASEFSSAITKPNGNAWQVGDNDSGRFLKLTPHFETVETGPAIAAYANLHSQGAGHSNLVIENQLDHTHLNSAIAALVGRNADPSEADAAVILALIGARGWLPMEAVSPVVPRINRTVPANNIQARAAPASTRRRIIDLPEGLDADVSIQSFPDFGVFVFRSPDLFLGVRCGPVGQNGIGGHAHNDQLAIELNVRGEDWISDPGTYLYTSLPQLRNAYRSVSAHSAPHPDGDEQAVIDAGLFRLAKPWSAECISFGTDNFVGEINKERKVIRREIRLTATAIEVIDSSWGCTLSSAENPPLQFSPAYGWRESLVGHSAPDASV